MMTGAASVRAPFIEAELRLRRQECLPHEL
jgi:hypothetical protein